MSRKTRPYHSPCKKKTFETQKSWNSAAGAEITRAKNRGLEFYYIDDSGIASENKTLPKPYVQLISKNDVQFLRT